MGGGRDHDAEVDQTERQITYDTAFMWNLKKDTNELTKQT